MFTSQLVFHQFSSIFLPQFFCFNFFYQKRCITHPNIEYSSLFQVEIEKLKKIVKNMSFFVMKSAEIK